MDSCQRVCPATFSPIIIFNSGNTLFINRDQSEAVISVNIRANPEPTVQWSHNGRNISQFHRQFEVLDDHSLVVKHPTDLNAGKYTIMSSNGVGAPTHASVNVIIFPLLPTIIMTTEKNIYKPGETATILCKVKGDDHFYL